MSQIFFRLLLIASVLFTLAGAVQAEMFKTEVTASSEPLIAASKYRLWIPENSPRVRCLFVINKRGAGPHLFFKDQEWRGLAKRTQSAILYCEFEAYGVRDNGYGLSILKACEQFATELERPELKHAPFVLWGHSMGGRVTQDFVRFEPSRVLTFLIGLRANPSPEEFMEEEAEAKQVPGLYLMGASDRKPQDIREHFHRARAVDSPRAWIWLPGQGHWPKGMDAKKDESTKEEWRAWIGNDVVIPWTEAMIQLRLPGASDASSGPIKLRNLDIESGWLGNIATGRIAPTGDFEGESSRASWFPSEKVAKAWVGFSFPKENL